MKIKFVLIMIFTIFNITLLWGDEIGPKTILENYGGEISSLKQEEKSIKVIKINVKKPEKKISPKNIVKVETKKEKPILKKEEKIIIKHEPIRFPKDAEIKLEVGESKVIPVYNITRAAVGNNNVADVIVVSSNELLINAKQAGATTLTVWAGGMRKTYKVLVRKQPQAIQVVSIPLKNIRLETVEYDSTANKITVKTDTATATDITNSLLLILDKDKYSINPNLNSIVVQGTEEDVDVAKKLIESIDKPIPGVMMEAKIMEVAENDLKEIGLDWTIQKDKIKTTYDTTSGGKISFNSIGTLTENYLANLNALVTEGKGRLLANPKILCQDRKIASIVIGDEVPIVTTTSTSTATSTSVTYMPVGVILSISPHIDEQGYIDTFIYPNVSYISDWRGDYPLISKRASQSYIKVKDGESFVIGGLLKETETNVLYKVPILGDLPFFGNFFRNRKKEKTKTEIIVVITPHIIK